MADDVSRNFISNSSQPIGYFHHKLSDSPLAISKLKQLGELCPIDTTIEAAKFGAFCEDYGCEDLMIGIWRGGVPISGGYFINVVGENLSFDPDVDPVRPARVLTRACSVTSATLFVITWTIKPGSLHLVLLLAVPGEPLVFIDPHGGVPEQLKSDSESICKRELTCLKAKSQARYGDCTLISRMLATVVINWAATRYSMSRLLAALEYVALAVARSPEGYIASLYAFSSASENQETMRMSKMYRQGNVLDLKAIVSKWKAQLKVLVAGPRSNKSLEELLAWSDKLHVDADVLVLSELVPPVERMLTYATDAAVDGRDGIAAIKINWKGEYLTALHFGPRV